MMLTLHRDLKSYTRNADKVPPGELSSDPIEKFSSPSGVLSTFGRPAGLLTTSTLNPATNMSDLVNVDMKIAQVESSDDDMPAIGDVLLQGQVMRNAQETRQMLHAKKMAILQTMAGGYSNLSDDDDDLEVVNDEMHTVAREEAANRRVDKAKHSPATKRILAMAIPQQDVHPPSVTRSKSWKLPTSFKVHLEQLAKPAFLRSGKDDIEPLTKQQLDCIMVAQHERLKLKMIQQREEEWVRKGGRLLRSACVGQDPPSQIPETQLQQGFEETGKGGSLEEASADENESRYESDLEALLSPKVSEVEGGGPDSDQDQEDEAAPLKILEHPADSEAHHTPSKYKPGIRRSTRMVLDSDDESGDQSLQHSTSALFSGVPGFQDVLSLCESMSSPSSLMEDDNDKENNTQLMFDRSEDKENTAVVRYPSLSTPSALRTESLVHGGCRGRRDLLMAFPSANVVATRTASKEGLRSPLKELSTQDDDPFAFPSSSNFTARTFGTPPSTPPGSAMWSKQSSGSPATLRDERSRRPSHFSSDGGSDENDPPCFKPQILLPSFMETSVKRSPELFLAPFNPTNRGLSQFFSDDDPAPMRVKSKINDLSLTLDTGLQPALEVSSTLRRKAHMILEKEQAYIVAAAHKDQRPKEVLYVNDHGFLTQTRPEESSPQVYRMTPSQTTKYSETQAGAMQCFSERLPLRTLSFVSTQDSPEPQPLRRLRRRSASPLEHLTARNSPSSLVLASQTTRPSKINAFDILAKFSKPPATSRKALDKSMYVAMEAEESDEDDMFGFGGPKKKEDEEEEDEDENKVIEGLVDDTGMDVETERPDLVQEKFREHKAEDDRELEKLHQEVAEGKYRKKRLGRGVDLDNESDEEDEARRIRQRTFKKRKIDSDNLEALGQDEETKAFYNAYHQGLVDDGDEELEHLRNVPIESDDEDLVKRETITVDEVRERVRGIAQGDADVEVLDPVDTSWLDNPTSMEDETGILVKVMTRKKSKTTTRVNHVIEDSDLKRPKRCAETDVQKKAWCSWAKKQGNQHYGTGRSTSGVAVTGHTKVKSGGGSLRSGSTVKTESKMKRDSAKPSKAPSMLSTVSDRSSRFS